jgi:hypothetical protein
MRIKTILNGYPPRLLRPLAALAIVPGMLFADLEVRPKEMGASVDFGQIKGGAVEEDQILTRTGVFLTGSGVYDKKLDIRVTVGGLFWYPLPEFTTPERTVRFGPGVGQAQAIWSFGDPESPWAKLRVGLFANKYNPDAKNLGEYLFRSGTYPGALWTGGWSYLNSAAYMAQGAALNISNLDGKLTHDFSLFMERDIEPTNDLSPGYIITYKPSSAFEVSSGVVWAHALSLNSDRLTPKDRKNAYDKRTNLPLSLEERGKPGYAEGDAAIVPETIPDPAGGGGTIPNPLIGQQVPGRAENVVYVTAAQNGVPSNQLEYYTFKGFKTMFRTSLDIGALLGVDAIPAGDFKIYGEIALLGVQDQPYYYEHKDERMPMMGGINIPTFGLLDRLSMEVEYHKSRFQNTVGLVYDRQLPLPLNSEAENPLAFTDSAVAANKGSFAKDDWKWSLYGHRKITEGVTLTAQVASDYLRSFGAEVKPTSIASTVRPKDWYYMLRLDFGLF